jgi:hypothetical protein
MTANRRRCGFSHKSQGMPVATNLKAGIGQVGHRLGSIKEGEKWASQVSVLKYVTTPIQTKWRRVAFSRLSILFKRHLFREDCYRCAY